MSALRDRLGFVVLDEQFLIFQAHHKQAQFFGFAEGAGGEVPGAHHPVDFAAGVGRKLFGKMRQTLLRKLDDIPRLHADFDFANNHRPAVDADQVIFVMVFHPPPDFFERDAANLAFRLVPNSMPLPRQ